MTITKAILVIFCISMASTTSAQIDSDPDGIGVYFDEGATQVSAAVPNGESISAYLIATNPSQTGTLALWEASVALSEGGALSGEPLNGFNMGGTTPGDYHVSFAVGMHTPYPELQPIMILANLTIEVLSEGPINIYVGGYTFDWPMYRPNDMYHGPDTTLFRSSGSPVLPVAVINGENPLANEVQLWDGIKSLYR